MLYPIYNLLRSRAPRLPLKRLSSVQGALARPTVLGRAACGGSNPVQPAAGPGGARAISIANVRGGLQG
jgi:hypothetical protein